MRSSDIKTALPIVALLSFFLLSIQGCQDNGVNYTPPDYSTVPAAWDTTAADSSFTTGDGNVKVYVMEKGNGIFKVNERDQVSAYYTGRLMDGTVFASTYEGGSTIPANLTISNLIEGFRLGMLGMSEGERRVIVIPPTYGYGTSSYVTRNSRVDVGNKTLVYDVELSAIVN